MSALKLRFLHKGAAAVSAYYTYDNSIGVGNVDSAGFANLPLRGTGAKRYYINSSTGSDSNTSTQAQNPATPWATAAKAAAQTITDDGLGSQFLFAEGTTYAEVVPSVSFLSGGFSYAYPLVFQSYDPTDPTNEAKMGRAHGTGSHARPKFTANTATGYGGGNWGFTGSLNYIAARGLEINSGDNYGQSLGIVSCGSGILFENNIMAYGSLNLDTSGRAVASRWIFRNNAIYGSWGNGTLLTGATQSIYVDGCDSITIEDNILWHAGWGITHGTRGDGTTTGDASVFSHAIYEQGSDYGTCVSRRNFIADVSADGGTHRADALVTGNVTLTTPIAIALGGGHGYDIRRPFGCALDHSYNAIIGTAQVNVGAGAKGWGLSTSNGKANGLSLSHRNVLAHGDSISEFANSTYLVDNDFATTTSYLTVDHNVSYQWIPSGGTIQITENGFTGTCHFTATNSYWDDTASGSNLNISSGTFPNTYTEDQLCAAAGYTDKATAIAYAIANPEQRIQRQLNSLALAGYGITPTLRDLAIDATFVTGQINAGMVVGTVDGSVLTYSGFPSNVTVDSDGRAWHDDGTATVTASGTWSITETHPTLGAHTSTGTWNTYLAPLLTSPTSSSVTATTATIGVTTNTASGNLYYIVKAGAWATGSPRKAEVELHHDTNGTDYLKFGSQAISTTGAKTASLTGLTTATLYNYAWVHVITTSGQKVYSVVSTGTFTTS